MKQKMTCLNCGKEYESHSVRFHYFCCDYCEYKQKKRHTKEKRLEQKIKLKCAECEKNPATAFFNATPVCDRCFWKLKIAFRKQKNLEMKNAKLNN